MFKRMDLMWKCCRSIMGIAAVGLLLAVFPAVSVRAEEANITPGMSQREIQTVLDRANGSSEALTVTFQPGEYVLSAGGDLCVYSNTAIEAEGAIIRAASSGQRALNIGNGENVQIHGGTWLGKDNEAIVILNSKGNVVLDGVTVNMSNGNFERSIQISGGSGVTVRNSSFAGAAVYVGDVSGIVFENNTIQGSKSLNPSDASGIGFHALRLSGNSQIIKNSIDQSDYTGFFIQDASDTVIKGNQVNNSVNRGSIGEGEKHGEGLVIESCKGVAVEDNTVTNTRSLQANNGNGIIVNRSENVTVNNNRVENSGNHGIQVSYQSKNVTVSHNVVSNSGNMGISVSRGAQADIKDGNEISSSRRFGITFDGQEGVVSGSITDCTISGNGEGGIALDSSAVATVDRNTLIDNAPDGIVASRSSTLIASGNKVYLSSQQTAEGNGRGIAVLSSNASLENNIIGNYFCGIYGMKSTVNGSNNVVNYQKADSQEKKGYFMEESSGSIIKVSLLLPEVTEDMARGVCLVPDLEAGVVAGGARYSVRTKTGEWFEPSFPKQSDWNSVIVYVLDNSGNVICANAAPTYDFHNAQIASGGAGDGAQAQVQAFVTRLYQLVLRRAPENGEDQNWINKLMNHTASGAEVAQGFFFSQEFTEVKKVSDEEFVNILYRTMMNREADAGGYSDWTDSMKNGMSREYVYHGFAESQEFTNICGEYGIERGSVTLSQPRDQNRKITEFVARNYQKAIGRNFDVDGLNDWCNRLLTGEESPKMVVKGFVFSSEFILKNYSNEEFVTILYATCFDREPDQAGFEDWTGQLRNGASRETVEAGFAEGTEFDQLIQSFGLN